LINTIICFSFKTFNNGLKINKSKSGTTGSDQIAFYLKNIPVLFFFTGAHSDYHKPTDDADKINFVSETKIIGFAKNLLKTIVNTDSLKKFPFSKTKDIASGKRPSMMVTLGVVPDFSFEGKGMKIAGVTDEKPASIAGMLAGDIVLKIGNFEIADMASYMKALGNFKKSDKTSVVIKRGEEIITKDVQF